MERAGIKQRLRIALVATIPLLILVFLYLVRFILLPFILAGLLAYFVNPLIIPLVHRGVPRTVAILITYLILGVIFTGVFVFGVPAVTGEITHFGETIPRYVSEVQGYVKDAQERYDNFALPEGFRLVIDERIRGLERILLQMVRNTLAGLTGFFSFLISFAIAPILAFYILKDIEDIKRGLQNLIPCRWRPNCQAIFRDVDEIITNYIRGNLTVAAILGFLTGLGYFLIGMEYSIILGIIAAVTDLIPFFGPFLGAVPAVALALLTSKYMVFKALIVVVVSQQIECQVITPKIMGDTMGLNPLAIIFVILAGGELFGLVGILLALPATAIMRVIGRYLFYWLID